MNIRIVMLFVTQDCRSCSKQCCPAGRSSMGDLVLYPESQTRQFQDFLTRANRYPSLVVGGVSGSGDGGSNRRAKKIVLVEVIIIICFEQNCVSGLTFNYQ